MCGIVGVISGKRGSPDVVEQLVDVLAHRGPDDRGAWIDREAQVGLGHQRLSIVDLSPQGHQPMMSADGRWVITYNGEIYNHGDIRAELGANGRTPASWRGHSDTETLVDAIAAWGLERALNRASGMFAFGLWDRFERKLYLVRDRFGEKPLYYGWVGGDFVFGSELKALTAHRRFDNQVNRDAVDLLMRRGYIPAPLSIYQNVFKLPPGCILQLTPAAVSQRRDEAPAAGTVEGGLSLREYWSYAEVLERGASNPIDDERDALEQLEQTLASAVRAQSIADVPVGAFLSGGIDSSAVVALYQKHSAVPVRSFTIGFENAQFDEAVHARAIAQHLGTVHSEHYVTAADAAAAIPRLPRIFDEPFGDSSAIPTLLLSEFARRQVKVVLSGDGGDELFAGYRRHAEALAAWKSFRRVPMVARRAGAAALRCVPPRLWSDLERVLSGPRRRPLAGKVYKAVSLGGSARSFDDLYAGILDHWPAEKTLVHGASARHPFPLDPGFAASDALRMLYCDAQAYLPGDILCKVDRATMSTGLECRVPFLDHHVAEVAARIPMSMKLRSGKGKWIARAMLGRHVPSALFERPKSGFSMPLADWLRGDLRDWAEDLLDPSRMRQDGFLDTDRVQERWHDNLHDRRNSSSALWSILMFQAWLRGKGRSERIAQARADAA